MPSPLPEPTAPHEPHESHGPGGSGRLDMAEVVGSHDLLLVTLDTLRHDVAVELAAAGRIPHLARHLPGGGWEERHAPGSFTYASHQAMFAGFLPTPASPGPHPRLFAARFAGSETTADGTFVFDTPDLVSGLAAEGYRTVCIGGVGFFNRQGPLGSVLPGMFQESHWEPGFGVASPTSFEEQVARAEKAVAALPGTSGCSSSSTCPPCTSRTGSICPERPARRATPAPRTRRPWSTWTGIEQALRRGEQPPPLLRHRLFRPRHGLRRRRLHRSPARPPGRLDRPVRPLLPRTTRMRTTRVRHIRVRTTRIARTGAAR